MRISECVGLNLQDVDLQECKVKVTRKGGDEILLYFGPEVEEALKKHIESNLLGHANVNTTKSISKNKIWCQKFGAVAVTDIPEFCRCLSTSGMLCI
jgi:site-specific recombinase XerD